MVSRYLLDVLGRRPFPNLTSNSFSDIFCLQSMLDGDGLPIENV